jgi:hypothetical protein
MRLTRKTRYSLGIMGIMGITLLAGIASSYGQIAAPAATAPAEPLPLGAKRLADGSLQIGQIIVRRERRELAFPAHFNMQAGALEAIIVHPHGRLHEALLCSEVKALQVQAMLYLLGAENGPRQDSLSSKRGDLVDMDIEWTDASGAKRRDPVEAWIFDNRTEKPMTRIGWVFVGSRIKDGHFLADGEGNIAINYAIGESVLSTPDAEGEDDTIHSVNSQQPQPASDAEVTVVFTLRPKQSQDETKKPAPAP